MKFKNIFKNSTRMTTENKLNEEIVDQTPIENNENNTEALDASIEERVEEISREEQLSQDLASEKDKFLRLFAEFENYKRRTAKERIDLINTAGEDIFKSLLPILDDFERAIKSNAETTDIKAVNDGVNLIYNKLKSNLTSKGLQEMKSHGETFDADIHEAITNIPAPSDDLKGKVVDELEKGYSLNGKIIRFAKVVIGN